MFILHHVYIPNRYGIMMYAHTLKSAIVVFFLKPAGCLVNKNV